MPIPPQLKRRDRALPPNCGGRWARTQPRLQHTRKLTDEQQPEHSNGLAIYMSPHLQPRPHLTQPAPAPQPQARSVASAAGADGGAAVRPPPATTAAAGSGPTSAPPLPCPIPPAPLLLLPPLPFRCPSPLPSATAATAAAGWLQLLLLLPLLLRRCISIMSGCMSVAEEHAAAASTCERV